MTEMFLDEEAEQCRQRARAYLGKAEAPFLLSIAREFERLARERQPPPKMIDARRTR